MSIFIYKIVNSVNNKVYIGQTIRPVEQRFKRHITDAINGVIDTHLSRAIRKYGKDNFNFEIIDTAATQEELTLKEKLWIDFFKEKDNCGVYNETNATYKCGGNTYLSKTQEELKLIGGKLSETKKGKRNPNAVSVKCFNIDTKEELFFETVNECRIYFKENTHRFVTERVTGRIVGLYKNKWKIAYANYPYKEFKQAYSKKGIGIEIRRLDTNEITMFDSVRLAARTLCISRNIIKKHMKKNKTNFIIKNYEFTILN